MAGRSAAYIGRVTHRRLRPVEHKLEYKVFSLLLDLDELPSLAKSLTWFSRGGFNLFSFHDQDYGSGKPANLAAYIRERLSEFDIDASGPLELLCYPRVLGYIFNPLAVYYCHDGEGVPSAVIYEVSNTFKERHSYVIPLEPGMTSDDGEGIIRQVAGKSFHVSPFMAMDMTYHFRTRRPAEEATIVIRETDAEGTVFTAAFSGMREPLTDKTLRRLFFGYPLMTVKVIMGIHLEAMKLIKKGMKLREGDPAPTTPMSLVR